ncbi:MAG TPA: xylan 1,4-beta-xylosidase [Firmicutes bacterium]|nr:xylan 1,4-beta-xylosidase [Bacillota bacterium]
MLSGHKIILDTETGVNYLFTWDGYAGGLTTLLDRDGTPVVTGHGKYDPGEGRFQS